MSPYWSALVRRLRPYVPGEQRAGGSIVKLNTNENPYPPSPRVLEAIRAVDGETLSRYPDPDSAALCQALAAYHGIDADTVIVGNGSDEVLALAFMAFFTGVRPLAYPAISYSFYPVYCDLLSIPKAPLSLTDDFELELERFQSSAGGVVFPNPNAPTGRAVERSAIAALLDRFSHGVVLIDEAYADFGAPSAIDLIRQFPNLLITRTFSKGRSLAGMRVGYACGQACLIDALRRVKNSFNCYPLDAVAERAALASLRDEVYYREQIARIVDTREQTANMLRDRDFRVLPSRANFLFVSPPDGRAEDLYQRLSNRGILVRHWSALEIDRWLRISIGSPAQMQALLASIDSVMSEP